MPALASSSPIGSAMGWKSLDVKCGVLIAPVLHAETCVISANVTIRSFDRQDIDWRHAEYDVQKETFMKRASEEPLFLAPYRGKFIASRDGQIVESDSDLAVVTNRFFTRHGDVPVYIGRVDGKRKVFIDSPNRVR